MSGPQVLLRDDLVEQLGGRRAFARALDEGSWRRVLHGAYAPSSAAEDPVVRARAAQLLLPDHARVCDRFLLSLLGVDVLPGGPPLLELVVPRGAVPSRRPGVRARTAELPDRDCSLLEPPGLRVLRPARAVADLLRRLPPTEAVVTADAVRHAHLVSLEDLRDELARHARGLRGVQAARRALDLSDARAESPPESRVRVALVAAGLSPCPQHEVVVDGQFLARVDLALPQWRIAIEFDGRAVHERQDVFVRDRHRQNDLVRAGWLVLRFTAVDLRFGASYVVAQVLAAVASRRAA